MSQSDAFYFHETEPLGLGQWSQDTILHGGKNRDGEAALPLSTFTKKAISHAAEGVLPEIPWVVAPPSHECSLHILSWARMKGLNRVVLVKDFMIRHTSTTFPWRLCNNDSTITWSHQ